MIWPLIVIWAGALAGRVGDPRRSGEGFTGGAEGAIDSIEESIFIGCAGDVDVSAGASFSVYASNDRVFSAWPCAEAGSLSNSVEVDVVVRYNAVSKATGPP